MYKSLYKKTFQVHVGHKIPVHLGFSDCSHYCIPFTAYFNTALLFFFKGIASLSCSTD